MRSLKNLFLLNMMQGLMIIICVVLTPSLLAQELNNALSLRLGPGIGYPINIELPSGTFVEVIWRRNSWLLVQDQRGQGGWAKITDVGLSGGLDERLAWRLSELKKEKSGSLVGRWFNNELGYGVALGWKVPFYNGYGLTEIAKATNANAAWQSVSTWYLSEHTLSGSGHYTAGIGLGYSQENANSHVFSESNKSSDAVFGGVELGLGVRPLKHIDTGFSVRYLFASSSDDADSTLVTWYWSFEL